MGSQNVPQLQQNSLPLLTIAQATAGVVVNFGAGQSRYWDGAALGVNATTIQNITVGAGAYYYLATNWLDMRGCTNFAFVLQRLVGAANPLALAFAGSLKAQMRFGVSDSPQVTYIAPGGGSVNDNFAGKTSMNTAAITFPAGVGGDKQRALITWGPGDVAGVAGAAITLGYDMRLIFDWGTNNPVPGGDNSVYTMYLWGQG